MSEQRLTTLPTDSTERKGYPLFRGCFRYFPAALAGVARISKLGNDKHNPGEQMHHARGKSMDHGDCVLRHLQDLQDLLAALERGSTEVTVQQVLDEADQLSWRSLALSQEVHERFGAPLAPGAKGPSAHGSYSVPAQAAVTNHNGCGVCGHPLFRCQCVPAREVFSGRDITRKT